MLLCKPLKEPNKYVLLESLFIQQLDPAKEDGDI